MAGVKLHLATQKIWTHFFSNFDRLQEYEDCVAENNDNGMSLYITANTIFPVFVLYARDTPLLMKPVKTEKECNQWAVYLVMKYIAEVKTDGTPKSETEEQKVIELPPPSETSKNEEECEDEEVIEVPDDEESDQYQEMVDTIYEREDALSKAMGDFLAVALLEDDYNAVVEGYTEAFINECVDDFLQYLYDNHMVSIYRPTIEVDHETGSEILKEYPYGWGEDYETE